jgi:hypothetical protein
VSRSFAPPPRSLTDVVLRRTGVSVRSWRLVVFIHEWAMCEAEAGERVGIERFGAWWPESTRTAYRRLAEFQEVFGADLGPDATPSNMIVWPDGLPAREAIERERVGFELVPA